MKKAIFLSVEKPDEAFARMERELSRYADVTVVGADGYSLVGADVFIGKKLSAATLASADRLKAVFAYKTGVEDFPLAELDAAGVTVCNSHVNSDRIAQYAFALATTLTARTAEYDRLMRKGDWAGADPFWRSIFSMKVGLVGYGGIGREIHKILAANGIAAYTLDRGKAYAGITAVPALEELCGICDLLMLSLPKTACTDNMFDARIFALLRGKYIVNVGRSNCIDERALFDALKSGALRGAAIDTWREKPKHGERLKPFDLPFDTLDNLLLSSHKAMFVSDGHERYCADTTENVIAYLDGKTPRNIVNPKKGY